MDYPNIYHECKDLFSFEKERTDIPGSGISIYMFRFRSTGITSITTEPEHHGNLPNLLTPIPDYEIQENLNFSYPVFVPQNADRFKKAIILLHGLNERSWTKYLSWAYYLALHTGRPVILFPISFHINRAPKAWSDPKAMFSLLNVWNKSHKIDMSTFANLALSIRLTDDPNRFFNSGYQSALDLMTLTRQIKEGKHPLMCENSEVNIFAYSIGAFLSEILLIGNPENLFSDTKLFIFCGGSFFEDMNGTSRLIMDGEAFHHLQSYYLNDFGNELKTKSSLAEFIKSTNLGKAFYSMLSFDKFKSYRENILQSLKDRIKIITLKKDTVIPPSGILKVFNNKGAMPNIEIMDFPYEYTHEVPFPVDNKNMLSVDNCFKDVFQKAASFLM